MTNSKWTHHVVFIYTYVYISVYIFNNNIKEEFRNLRVCRWNTGGVGVNRWRCDVNIVLLYGTKNSKKEEE